MLTLSARDRQRWKEQQRQQSPESMTCPRWKTTGHRAEVAPKSLMLARPSQSVLLVGHATPTRYTTTPVRLFRCPYPCSNRYPVLLRRRTLFQKTDGKYDFAVRPEPAPDNASSNPISENVIYLRAVWSPLTPLFVEGFSCLPF